MIKLTEGQLQFWESIVDLGAPKSSLINQLFEEFVKGAAQGQAVAPDIVPSTVSIHPDIDAQGKLIDTVAAGFKQPGFDQNGRLVDSQN
jgi:acyl carrier protein phosphodiesterase